MGDRNNIVQISILFVLGIAICIAECLVVKRMTFRTQTLVNAIQGNSKEIRRQNRKLQRLLRIYQIEQIVLLAGAGLCAVLLVIHLAFHGCWWVNYIAVIIPVASVAMFVITKIVALDSTSYPKSRRQEIVEAIVFVVFLVLSIVSRTMKT